MHVARGVDRILPIVIVRAQHHQRQSPGDQHQAQSGQECLLLSAQFKMQQELRTLCRRITIEISRNETRCHLRTKLAQARIHLGPN